MNRDQAQALPCDQVHDGAAVGQEGQGHRVRHLRRGRGAAKANGESVIVVVSCALFLHHTEMTSLCKRH